MKARSAHHPAVRPVFLYQFHKLNVGEPPYAALLQLFIERITGMRAALAVRVVEIVANELEIALKDVTHGAVGIAGERMAPAFQIGKAGI